MFQCNNSDSDLYCFAIVTKVFTEITLIKKEQRNNVITVNSQNENVLSDQSSIGFRVGYCLMFNNALYHCTNI